MAHSKSALKRLRTGKLANIRNRARNNELKTLEKRFRAAVAAGEKENAAALHKQCCSRVDKAVKANAIHVNKAANKKSQFDRLFQSLSAQ